MKVLVSDKLSEQGIEILKRSGLEVDVKTNLTPEELVLDFGLNTQMMPNPTETIKLSHRVVMNFYTAKRLLGALMNVVRRFESTDNRIIALSVVDSTDCAIVRLVLGDPERAYETFEQGNLPFTESDLLVVMLPDGPQPLVQTAA